ncbi:hypothetical protein N7523_001195 [Penicillium sp. IBT 18751x]|nr:hypothetical protein N7523_001195 [Penicillium sp. IBT 18751x]
MLRRLIVPHSSTQFGAAVEVGSVSNVLTTGVDDMRNSGVELRVVGPRGGWVVGRMDNLLIDLLEVSIRELKRGVDKTTVDEDGVRPAENENENGRSLDARLVAVAEDGQLMLVAVTVDVTVVVAVV